MGYLLPLGSCRQHAKAQGAGTGRKMMNSRDAQGFVFLKEEKETPLFLQSWEEKRKAVARLKDDLALREKHKGKKRLSRGGFSAECDRESSCPRKRASREVGGASRNQCTDFIHELKVSIL
jgi:hypothetical protein